MKKLMLLVVATMVIGLFAGCGASEPDVANNSDNTEKGTDIIGEDIYKDVTPLDNPVDLKIGISAGASPGFNVYLADKLGAFKDAGINAEIIVFGNGPLMVEATASNGWDVGAYGLGGTLAGTIGQGIINIGAASKDHHSIQIFADKESDIVKAGQVTESASMLYGTAETWKDKEIFLPVGTTLHYVFNKGLEHLGLTDKDVTLTHMDVPNINTALRAGRCEVGGVWGNYSYGDLNDKFVPVIQAEDIGVRLITTLVANPSSYEDPEKKEAIKTFLDIYFRTAEWINANDENRAQAAKMYQEWNDENGIKTTEDEVTQHLTYSACYSLEENYELFNTTGDSGYSLITEYNLLPLEFFINNGNYKSEDAEKLTDEKYFDSELVTELYNERNK